ncbi:MULTISPECIES: substrate-binding domain-containing protein [unclassified Polynucleobacter]|jgi:molybdate transport system substrate-binding protein|uniref:substrate-binding domain-containing protein n=1 Tax=unclassified Polynucleobacter TaxID=2640945 RepID=UPI00092B0FAA|nr:MULTISPECIES: substrate-binding domain-containing protein [unclassified Polynucleobacter]MBU3537971.1 substrate-binding domain-containing protein [Polynucleobacter sp. UK-Gri1-W3]OJI05152.1 molybdenum ABC transporter substrate-binding protein [Polynucleobacter sp. MWH-Adler-W8]
MRKLFFVSLILVTNVLSVGFVHADEIRVITSGAFAEALKDLVPEYEKQSPNKVIISYGSSMGAAPDSIPSRLAKGEQFDVLILAAPALDGFIKNGVVQSGTRVDLVESVMGAVVKAGAPKPDISTMSGLKAALLNAKSVAYSASASGVYLSTELFPKMGISEQMDKTARKIYSERVASVVARGDADLGFQQVSELLPIPGVTFIGELPQEAQKTVLFSAGITSNTQNVHASKDLIMFLASTKAAPTIQKAGLKPVLPTLPW